MASPSPAVVAPSRYDQAIQVPLFLAGLIAAVPTLVLIALTQTPSASLVLRGSGLWLCLDVATALLCAIAARWLYKETLQNNHPGIMALAIGFAGLFILRLCSLLFPQGMFWHDVAAELWVLCFASFTVFTIAVTSFRRKARAWMLSHRLGFWALGSGLWSTVLALVWLLLKPQISPTNVSMPVLAGSIAFVVLVSAFVLQLYREKRTSVILCFGLALFLHGLHTMASTLFESYTLGWWFGVCLDFGSLFLVVYGILEANRLQERLRLLGTLALRSQELERSNADLRNSEDHLRQALKMEAIGRLAGGVAHDFNNLLTVIHGFSDLLVQDLAPDDPRRAHAEKISSAARSASSLTYQLLAFGRKQLLAPVVLSLNGVVRDFSRMLPRLLGEDIALTVHLCPDSDYVRVDRNQLEQVIMNLAVNARDAMPRGGKLTIETTVVEVDQSYSNRHFNVAPGTYVMLAITDTGTGIDAATQDKIFDPFFTTKEMGKGTGLGLSTVYGIVKQSEGHIWVYSEVGKGTTFKIYLPQARQAPEVAAKAGVPSYRGSENILLVEDAEDVRNFTRTCLMQQGYTVVAAKDATEALELAEARPIDLLLTDVVMPGFSGLELAEELLSTRKGMKVLMMSGYSDVAFGKEAELPAGSGFLAKPFTRDKLLQHVREVLDGSKLPAASV